MVQAGDFLSRVPFCFNLRRVLLEFRAVASTSFATSHGEDKRGLIFTYRLEPQSRSQQQFEQQFRAAVRERQSSLLRRGLV